MDSSKKIYNGVVFKKTQLENTQGHSKNLPFSITFLFLSASFSFICPSNKAGNTAEWKEKKREAKSQ